MSDLTQENIKNIAIELAVLDKNIILIYAFNGTGKTRLSVAYKDITKERNEGKHSGVYYNAYSEDLFNWDNDEDNDGANVRLIIQKSSLNQFHSLLDEINLQEKLSPYKPKFDYRFKYFDDRTDGIESVQFFLKKEESTGEEEGTEEVESTVDTTNEPIKISRSEERIFVWCFFLALFDVEGWTGDGNQSTHFFIDDPVSSLDDNNIFLTVSSIMDLIERHFKDRKIIITTHHFGFISILHDWLKKGEKASSYKDQVQTYILKKKELDIQLVNIKRDVLLYHLELLQIIDKAINDDKLYAYHFATLRQVLENISSFIGVGRISFVLEQIGITDSAEISQIVNTLSHKTVFRYGNKELVPDNQRIFKDIFNKLQSKYNFILHTE